MTAALTERAQELEPAAAEDGQQNLCRGLSTGERETGLHGDDQLLAMEIGLQCGADIPGDRPLPFLCHRAERR